MTFPNEFLEQVRNANDIVSVMADYVSLKNAGHDFVCLCPFHSEKTPSCHIYTNTQSFYCFGCGKGGEVVTFIREIEHLEYTESVEFLAKRAGIPMPEKNYANSDTSKQRIKILEINRLTARFYRDCLRDVKGKIGWNYFTSRELTENTMKKYGLGYAPDEWGLLKNHLKHMGYSENDMLSAGVIVRGQNGCYDKFRGRVIFPIINKIGNVIGFGGRSLIEGTPAKYLNSEETLVFKKRQELFSLNFAKNSKSRSLILCEGYMDVITLNQAGFDNTVATLGTAITAEQARLMRAFKEVIIAYDSDEAGQKATLKAINLLNDVGINARVIDLAECKDPDNYIKKYGAEGFSLLLEGSGTAIGFEFNKLKIGLNLDTPDDKAVFLKKSVSLIASIHNSLDREIYISETARIVDVLPNNIKAAVDALIKKQVFVQNKEQNKNLINYGVTAKSNIPILTPAEKAERGIIAFVFHSPSDLQKIKSAITDDYFSNDFNKKLFKILTYRLENLLSIDLTALGSEFTSNEMGIIIGIEKQNEELPFDGVRLKDYIKVLVENYNKKKSSPPELMSDDEFRQYVENIKNK